MRLRRRGLYETDLNFLNFRKRILKARRINGLAGCKRGCDTSEGEARPREPRAVILSRTARVYRQCRTTNLEIQDVMLRPKIGPGRDIDHVSRVTTRGGRFRRPG